MTMLGIRRYPTLLFSLMGLFLFVTVGTSTFYAEERATKGKLALPGEDCQTNPLESWTPQEQWVWEQVCAGKIANFNLAKGYGGILDPKELEGWSEKRILRPSFLETILLHEPYRGALTRNGVRIVGALFKKPLDLSNATLTQQLLVHASRFESEVDLSYLQALRHLSLDGSKFAGKLNMNSIEVKEGLFMRRGAEFREVSLIGAKIRGNMEMDGSRFTGKLNMNRIEVDSSLFMCIGAEFSEVDLGSAKIGGQLAMIDSKFAGKLNMSSIEVDSTLFMRGGAEFGEVYLGSAKIGGNLEMDGSKFAGKLNMSNIEVDSSLFMRGGAEFGEVSLIGAKIRGNMEMDGSRFTGKLNMSNIEVKEGLFMRGGAEFGEVSLIGAKIRGNMEMDGSRFTGKLNMDSMRVRGYLSMRKKAEFSEVYLGYAKIEGNLGMTGSKFAGKLNMNSIEVKEGLFMRRGAEFAQPLVLTFAKIGKRMDLSGSTLASIDLTGTYIRGEFVLSPPAPQWMEGAKLTLRNVEVGALQDLPWPDRLELDGFTYACLGGFASDSAESMATREISWFKEWLKKQKSYSPQPYEQLARVLLESGHAAKSRKILFAAREQERVKLRKDGAWPSWFWAIVKLALIGHGYRIHYAIFWAIGFVLVGVGVLCISKQGRKNGMPYGFSYSLDLLLPVIRLREYHYEKVDIKGLARYYFYLHQIMGYVLASFLIGGLSGLIK